jgi:hypothetical protein
MANLSYAVSYILNKYPHKESLSEDRLQQMLYLADWKFAIEHQRRLTDIEWQIKDGKPFTDQKLTPIKYSDSLRYYKKLFKSLPNLVLSWFQGKKNSSNLVLEDSKKEFTEEKKKILDFVIRYSASKRLDDLIELVCSTYPVLGEAQLDNIDLVSIAKQYEKVRPALLRSQGQVLPNKAEPRSA